MPFLNETALNFFFLLDEYNLIIHAEWCLTYGYDVFDSEFELLVCRQYTKLMCFYSWGLAK